MNKADLSAQVARDLNISKALAEKAVQSMVDALDRSMKKGVVIAGFGSFAVVNRKARVGRDPRTGRPMRIPATKTVKFRPAPGLKGRI
jgi:DNA-binding protein HU-beta